MVFKHLFMLNMEILTRMMIQNTNYLQVAIYMCQHKVMTFENNNQNEDSRVFLYKKRYQPLEGYTPEVVSGNVNEMTQEP